MAPSGAQGVTSGHLSVRLAEIALSSFVSDSQSKEYFTLFNLFSFSQEFGRSSIKFHEPQCERKRVAEELRREKERQEEGEENKVSYIDHIGEDIYQLHFNI